MADLNIGSKTYISHDTIGRFRRDVLSFTVTSDASPSNIETRLKNVRHFFLRPQSSQGSAYTTVFASAGAVVVGGWPATTTGERYILESWGN